MAVSTTLAIAGERYTGRQAQKSNIAAVCAVADMLKTSLGCCGLDKILVDALGEITVTNDGATILKTAELVHPAAKLMADLAKKQDTEAGDGTTSVVLITAELLRLAESMISTLGMSVSAVCAGYRAACREALKHIDSVCTVDSSSLGRECLLACARTSLASKILANMQLFEEMAVDAAIAVTDTHQFCNIDRINILKAQGKSAAESELIAGYALACTPASPLMPRHVSKPRIACLNFDLQKTRLRMGISVVAETPQSLEEIRAQETAQMHQKVHALLKAGATVILTTKGIADSALSIIARAGAVAVRRCTKTDLENIAAITRTELVSNTASLDGSDDFLPGLGYAESFDVEAFGDSECIVFRGVAAGAASIVLRGPNEHMLEEMHRALHDALCCVKRVLETPAVVAGGGAVETELAVHLNKVAASMETHEQMAVRSFAEALCVIPRTLAENAAEDAIQLFALLNTAHQEQSSESVSTGIDLQTGSVCNTIKAGVVDSAKIKLTALKAAAEAATAILRIDELVVTTPKSKEQAGK